MHERIFEAEARRLAEEFSELEQGRYRPRFMLGTEGSYPPLSPR